MHAKFVCSASDATRVPKPSAPEVAFLGRSNVGKSSVINSLLGEKVARTSSTPGRTRAINFFEVRRPGQPRPDFVFADLPGYGYAKVAREISAEWPRFIEPYLANRETLALSIVLIDVNVPPQESDKNMVDWLRHGHRPFVVVATKADRLSGNQLSNGLRRLTEELQIEKPLPYSARTGTGRDDLWRQIRQACASGAPSSSESLAG